MSILLFIMTKKAQFSFEYIYFILHFPEHSRAIYFNFLTVLFLKCLEAQFSFEKNLAASEKTKKITKSSTLEALGDPKRICECSSYHWLGSIGIILS